MKVELKRSGPLRGEIEPPPDKSISHRAVMLCAIAEGTSRVSNFLHAGDTLSTAGAMRSLGVTVVDDGADLLVQGVGLDGLKEPAGAIDCGNSGTTMRLLSGLLAGQDFFTLLSGDESLSERPMGRVIEPLRSMGAVIMARNNDTLAPIAIRGGSLKGIKHSTPVASAQLKSALLLAGLFAKGTTEVTEPEKSRDHTERMLPAFGVEVGVDGLTVKLAPPESLRAVDIEVPGDFSSAAFFICAALTVPGSEVMIKNVGLNPLRTGLLKVLESMGASVEVLNQREMSGEPVGDVLARYCGLKGVEVGPDVVPSMIDEFPVLCAVAATAQGTTTIRGAAELRIKESDRVSAMAEGLRAMGVGVEEFDDGLAIEGTEALRGARVQCRGDHRIAMALSVTALAAHGNSTIQGAEAVDISYPGFYETLQGLGG